MTKPDRFDWARRVSRAKVRRLYQSDAQGTLDHDLLDEVGYGIYARCSDMFEVQQARKGGPVPCRNCRAPIPRQGRRWPQARRKAELLCCAACDWQVTWGEYFASYSGNRMLPDNRIGCDDAEEKMLLFTSAEACVKHAFEFNQLNGANNARVELCWSADPEWTLLPADKWKLPSGNEP